MPEPRLSTVYNGKTLAPGIFQATLRSSTNSYKNPIQLVGGYLIHPDQFTTAKKIKEQIDANKSYGPWSQPYSAGCQILKISDFDQMTAELKGIGFKYNNTDTIPVTIKALKGR